MCVCVGGVCVYVCVRVKLVALVRSGAEAVKNPRIQIWKDQFACFYILGFFARHIYFRPVRIF